MSVTVFLVEDDPDVRQYVEDVVGSDPGMRIVGTAGSVAEANRKLLHSRVDVLIVDLGLPDRSGIEVIRKAYENRVSDSILVFSVLGDETPVLSAIDAGAQGYLLKGGSPAELLSAIRAVASGFAPISPSIARHLLAKLRKIEDPENDPPTSTEQPSDTRLDALTEREKQVLEHISTGHTHKEVARKLNIAPMTVSTHVRNAYKKRGGKKGVFDMRFLKPGKP